jgi:hypothetical protein
MDERGANMNNRSILSEAMVGAYKQISKCTEYSIVGVFSGSFRGDGR